MGWMGQAGGHWSVRPTHLERRSDGDRSGVQLGLDVQHHGDDRSRVGLLGGGQVVQDLAGPEDGDARYLLVALNLRDESGQQPEFQAEVLSIFRGMAMYMCKLQLPDSSGHSTGCSSQLMLFGEGGGLKF